MMREKMLIMIFVIHTEVVCVKNPYATQLKEQSKKLMSMYIERSFADFVL